MVCRSGFLGSPKAIKMVCHRPMGQRSYGNLREPSQKNELFLDQCRLVDLPSTCQIHKTLWHPGSIKATPAPRWLQTILCAEVRPCPPAPGIVCAVFAMIPPNPERGRLRKTKKDRSRKVIAMASTLIAMASNLIAHNP